MCNYRQMNNFDQQFVEFGKELRLEFSMKLSPLLEVSDYDHLFPLSPISYHLFPILHILSSILIYFPSREHIPAHPFLFFFFSSLFLLVLLFILSTLSFLFFLQKWKKCFPLSLKGRLTT